MQRLASVTEAANWLRSRVGTYALRTDSRLLQVGDGFIAWPGAATDGRRYVAGALQAGASACLVEAQDAGSFGFTDSRIACLENLKAASGLIAAEYFEHPSQSLDMLAVTGTNGKTSTAWWLAQAINTLRKKEQSAQYSSGLIGTLGLGTPGQMQLTGLTTPDPVMLQAELARLRDAGASACAMEASSIGLAEHRMAGAQIRVAIFTNFTQDHLDYHGSMEAYWLAKRALFDWPSLQTAVINLDDPKGDTLMQHVQQRNLAVVTTSQLRTDATLWGGPVEYLATSGCGMRFEVHEAGPSHTVSCPVVGDYNAANMLGVIGALRSLGYSLQQSCAAISQCTAVPGRMETLGGAHQPLLVVDYAHTPDALEKALSALRQTAQARGGKLWCLFGCGGNRDPLKRPLMARAAEQGADKIMLTSDNPRSEAPQAIADQAMKGFAQPRQVQVQLDRAKAIHTAVRSAAAQDVILIAGKGHEDYQEIAGIKHPFSDKAQALAALQEVGDKL
jgi:UDP-N-acetylmuramyl-tripeptide synthetase